ncbi:hypothetical protein DRQ36_09975 [bacterium]|nr:MAG: hypothetical protein DRQ36_09975 [bacterium]
MTRPSSIVGLTLIVSLFALSGCTTEEKVVKETPGEVGIDFVFPKKDFSEGEVICVKIVLKNGTGDTISLEDYPAKTLELFDAYGKPVSKVQRTKYPKPPNMWLPPGDSSSNVVDLTCTFENSGPGMLAPGFYTIKTTTHYFAGKQARLRVQGYALVDTAIFEVTPPEGEAKEAFDAYFEAISLDGNISDFVGVTQIEFSEETRAKLDSIAEKYPFTPIGSRILVNDGGIWYRSVPLERYRKYMLEAPVECPCCLHRRVIDRMIKRYVLKREREEILDIVEESLEAHPEDTPVGNYLRWAFRFRMEDGFLIR